ncbi:MAG: tetratricopeptide repeat protein [Polyangiaceae bacterium]|nr:tetratricopeptide repeat protein [Polyangiaceae bacterium]
MGWFDRWRKSGRRSEISREVLFQAANTKDTERLAELCSEHADWIVANFPSWTTVPVQIRSDPASAGTYVAALMTIARTLAASGHPELLEKLMPRGDDNPLVRWPAKLTRARELLASGDADPAQEIVEQVIREMEPCSGPGVDEYLPKAWGILGEIHLVSGEHDGARQANERALGLCRQTGDHEGTVTYCGNLAEIARVRGDRVAHITWLSDGIEAAESAGLTEQAEKLRSQLQTGSEERH